MTVEELRKLVESKRNPVVVTSGVTPLSLLGVAFIVLKVMGYITWSWVWALAPFWIPVFIALVLSLILVGIVLLLSDNIDKEKTEAQEEADSPKEKDETPKEDVKESSKKKTSRKKKPNTKKDGENTEGKNGEDVK